MSLLDDCGRPVADGDSRKRIAGGKTSRNCARARNWLPGRCGLLPLLAYKQEGPLATQQLRIQDRKIMNRQRLRQHAALVARAVWLKQSGAASAVTQASAGTHV